ncbi:MAG: MFS transporter, partial [Actinomycetota bacterium]|nr:MFS transporter [Actinomycetota bacterium]
MTDEADGGGATGPAGPARPAPGHEGSPLRRALAAPGFRRLFAAQTISRWGDTFNSVALVVLVFDLTGSGVKVGVTVAFEIAPVLLFGFVAGAVVDRLPRQRVMVAADAGRAVVAVGLVVGQDHLWAIYAAAFALSSLSVFFNPAAASVVPALVDEEDVVGANAALWSAAVVSQIALAPLAGVLVATAGAGPAFALNAASFAASAALVAALALPAAVRPAPARHLHDVREGLG